MFAATLIRPLIALIVSCTKNNRESALSYNGARSAATFAGANLYPQPYSEPASLPELFRGYPPNPVRILFFLTPDEV